MNIPSAKTYAFWLALLRIYVGAFWILRALPKFLHAENFLPPKGSMAATIAMDAGKTSGFYHTFLANVVQPHLALFAQLDRFGEIGTGVLLLLGLFTRFGGLVGIFLGANYMLAAGYTFEQAWTGMAATAIALSAVNLVLPTGRFLGIDALIGRSRANGDTPPMPVPPKRSEPQVQPTAGPATDSAPPAPAPKPAEPRPNGANGGPAFAAPASAGPQVDQGHTQSA